MRIRCVAFGVRPPEEHILVAERQVEMDLAVRRLICVGGVTWESVGRPEPFDV